MWTVENVVLAEKVFVTCFMVLFFPFAFGERRGCQSMWGKLSYIAMIAIAWPAIIWMTWSNMFPGTDVGAERILILIGAMFIGIIPYVVYRIAKVKQSKGSI